MKKDGLVDAGVIPDDKRAHLEWGPVTEVHGRRGFRIEIERLGE